MATKPIRVAAVQLKPFSATVRTPAISAATLEAAKSVHLRSPAAAASPAETATGVSITAAAATATAGPKSRLVRARKPVADASNPVAKAIGKVGVGPVIERQPPVFQLNQFTRRIVRPRDLLVLEFTFVNLRVVKNANGGLELVRNQANKPAYLVVGFPPQHLL